jgi:hypothetical protein
MKAFLASLLIRLVRWLRRPSAESRLIDAQAQNRALLTVLNGLPQREQENFGIYSEMASEMIEARLMQFSGPAFGNPSPDLVREAREAVIRVQERALGLSEGPLPAGTGAYGDIELALQNVEWRREINMSWLEFSRWGIQQIILISRLYYIKNPLIRRAIDVSSVYVFGRGVEVTSTDDKANDVLKDFWERNRKTLGPAALMKLEKRKYYDGNLYFAFFQDEVTGDMDVRTIDATEIQEIITDPDDGDTEQLFFRVWETVVFDASTGARKRDPRKAYYPALGYKGFIPDTINGQKVEKSVPVYHRKCGEVAKWTMGLPIAYPALDWAKVSRQYLEACLTLAKSHAQIAWQFTTKGGQGAIEGMKQQLETTVNAAPGSSLWDQNPTPVNASIAGMGTGTTLSTIASRGKGLDPSEVKEFRTMVGMVFGIPPTWLGDMETANLSTATTLDRPTELGFRAKQVEWEEDLLVIAQFVLAQSAGATKGRLREALGAGSVVYINAAPRKLLADGRLVYDEAAKPKEDEIQVRVTFPAIREGDTPALVKAIAEAMTLDNKGGEIVGIDEKVGVRLLYEVFGVEDAEDILAEQYPDKDSGKEGDPDYAPKYDPCRTRAPLPEPIGKALPPAPGQPQLPGGINPGNQPQDKPVVTSTEAALQRLFEAARKLVKRRAA